MKTAKQILEEAIGNTDNGELGHQAMIRAMEEYASQFSNQLEPQVLKKIAVEYTDGRIILLKQGNISISYPKSDVKQFVEDLSRALNGERLSTLH